MLVGYMRPGCSLCMLEFGAITEANGSITCGHAHVLLHAADRGEGRTQEGRSHTEHGGRSNRPKESAKG